MKLSKGLAFGFALTIAGATRGEAQSPIRSLAPAKEAPQAEVPRQYRPPKGMCRIWIDNVPPNQQPAPTDCATAIRNKPQNARVIFSDEAKDKDGEKRKDAPKEEKKP